jgi:hypothetical protein
MSVAGQIWRNAVSGSVTLSCNINGTVTTYAFGTKVYLDASSGGASIPWNIGYAGGIVPVQYYLATPPYTEVGQGIGVSDTTGQVYSTNGLFGTVWSGRAGKFVGELVAFSGGTNPGLAVCIATGTSNNWQSIHT